MWKTSPTAARNGTSVETEAKVSEKVKLAGVVCLFRISADAEKGVEKGGQFQPHQKMMFVKPFLGSPTSEGPFLRSSMTFVQLTDWGNHVFFFSSFWCLSNDTMWIPAWQPVFFWTFKYISTCGAPFQFMYNLISLLYELDVLTFSSFHGCKNNNIRFIIPIPRMQMVLRLPGWSWGPPGCCCWRGITLQGDHR